MWLTRYSPRISEAIKYIKDKQSSLVTSSPQFRVSAYGLHQIRCLDGVAFLAGCLLAQLQLQTRFQFMCYTLCFNNALLNDQRISQENVAINSHNNHIISYLVLIKTQTRDNDISTDSGPRITFFRTSFFNLSTRSFTVLISSLLRPQTHKDGKS